MVDFGDIQVPYFEAACLHEDIGTLEVAMEDGFGVQEMESPADLQGCLPDYCLSDVDAGLSVVVDQVQQVSPTRPVHHDAEQTQFLIEEGCLVAHDVLRRYAREDPYFVQCVRSLFLLHCPYLYLGRLGSTFFSAQMFPSLTRFTLYTELKDPSPILLSGMNPVIELQSSIGLITKIINSFQPYFYLRKVNSFMNKRSKSEVLLKNTRKAARANRNAEMVCLADKLADRLESTERQLGRLQGKVEESKPILNTIYEKVRQKEQKYEEQLSKCSLKISKSKSLLGEYRHLYEEGLRIMSRHNITSNYHGTTNFTHQMPVKQPPNHNQQPINSSQPSIDNNQRLTNHSHLQQTESKYARLKERLREKLRGNAGTSQEPQYNQLYSQPRAITADQILQRLREKKEKCGEPANKKGDLGSKARELVNTMQKDMQNVQMLRSKSHVELNSRGGSQRKESESSVSMEQLKQHFLRVQRLKMDLI